MTDLDLGQEKERHSDFLHERPQYSAIPCFLRG